MGILGRLPVCVQYGSLDFKKKLYIKLFLLKKFHKITFKVIILFQLIINKYQIWKSSIWGAHFQHTHFHFDIYFEPYLCKMINKTGEFCYSQWRTTVACQISLSIGSHSHVGPSHYHLQVHQQE